MATTGYLILNIYCEDICISYNYDQVATVCSMSLNLKTTTELLSVTPTSVMDVCCMATTTIVTRITAHTHTVGLALYSLP